MAKKTPKRDVILEMTNRFSEAKNYKNVQEIRKENFSLYTWFRYHDKLKYLHKFMSSDRSQTAIDEIIHRYNYDQVMAPAEPLDPENLPYIRLMPWHDDLMGHRYIGREERLWNRKKERSAPFKSEFPFHKLEKDGDGFEFVCNDKTDYNRIRVKIHEHSRRLGLYVLIKRIKRGDDYYCNVTRDGVRK